MDHAVLIPHTYGEAHPRHTGETALVVVMGRFPFWKDLPSCAAELSTRLQLPAPRSTLPLQSCPVQQARSGPGEPNVPISSPIYGQ